MNLNQTRKEQIHHDRLQAWNYRGMLDFSSEFDTSDVLAGDNWVSSSVSSVKVDDDLTIFYGDMIIALVDNPGLISQANITANKWKLNRNAGTSGDLMIAATEFDVVTNALLPGFNYNTTTKFLTIHALPTNIFRATDNVNLYINSNKYTYKQFAIKTNSNQLLWKPGSKGAGFDIEAGDFIEIEVFRK